MHLLIGYLVALAVFLGGGYVGVQWLAALDNPPARAENSRPQSASARLINAKKTRDARALHRKQAESLAEGAEPAPARKQSDVIVADGKDRAAKTADQPDSRTAADAPKDAAPPQLAAATVAANDPNLDARAEAGPVVAPERTKAVQNESQSPQKPAGKTGGKTGGESVAARKSADAKASPAFEPAAGRPEVPETSGREKETRRAGCVVVAKAGDDDLAHHRIPGRPSRTTAAADG
jgi:cytoskeletal protein RodZ